MKTHQHHNFLVVKWQALVLESMRSGKRGVGKWFVVEMWCWLCALVLPSTSQPHTCGASLLVQLGCFWLGGRRKKVRREVGLGVCCHLQESHRQNRIPHNTAQARMALIHNSSVSTPSLFPLPTCPLQTCIKLQTPCRHNSFHP